MKKLASLVLAAVFLVAMLPIFTVPTMADTSAYPYPGNYDPPEGYYYIRNVGAGGYLGAENTSNGTRFHIQQKGDFFQIKKRQLATGKGKENAYAYQIIVVDSQGTTPGRSMNVMGTDGYPKAGTEINDIYDIGTWFARWIFDDAGNGNFHIRTYLDNSPNKGIIGTVHPYLDTKLVGAGDQRACLNGYVSGNANQLWELELIEALPKTIKGAGKVDDPYLISSSEQLKEFADLVAAGSVYTGRYFKLTNDITYNGPKIGTEKHPFRGIFDGDGHTITAQISSGSYTGLFSTLGGATVKNLKIKGKVSGTGELAGAVGAVAGYAYDGTVIDNCYVTADVSGADGNIGGIVGAMSLSTVSNCRMDGNVTNAGWTSTGGIVGGILGGGDMINCMNTGKVTGDKAVGGILGCVIGGETLIGNCSSLGSTAENTANGGNEHGGIVGFIDSEIKAFTIGNCFSKCNIGVSTNSGYIIGNNNNDDVVIAYYVYYTAVGEATKTIGTGKDFANARKNLLYKVESGKYQDTLQKLNKTAEGYRASGYDFESWIYDEEGLYPKSCKFGLSAAGSVLSKGSLAIIVGIAAAVVFGLGGFFLGRKKKKPALASGEDKDGE